MGNGHLGLVCQEHLVLVDGTTWFLETWTKIQARSPSKYWGSDHDYLANSIWRQAAPDQKKALRSRWERYQVEGSQTTRQTPQKRTEAPRLDMKQSLNLPKPPTIFWYILLTSRGRFALDFRQNLLCIVWTSYRISIKTTLAVHVDVLENWSFWRSWPSTKLLWKHLNSAIVKRKNEAKCGHMACMHPSWNLQTHRSTQTSSSNFSSCNVHLLTPKF